MLWVPLLAAVFGSALSKSVIETHVVGMESERSRHLIDLFRSHGLDKYIELPQVAVMGDTSSGKSSVLSAISGIVFPSSEKLTTRCPTQLILTKSDTFSGTVRLQRYQPKEGEAVKVERLESIEEATKIIARFTQQIVDEGQIISDDAIVIEAQGPDFPNLTLTDLPGLVRTVEDGEDVEIISRVRSLVNRYLNQKRTIILAIVPANVDMHNTEILHAAEEADPEGRRTVAIITKPDLIDKGAESSVVQLASNQRKALKLGYHVVKCRGQNDLNKEVTIQQSLENEKLFFETHDVWKSVNPDILGVPNLTMKLVHLLEETVMSGLPAVLGEIEKKRADSRLALSNMRPALETIHERRQFYSDISDNYVETMQAAFSGAYHLFPGFFDTLGHDNHLRALLRLKEIEYRSKMDELTFELPKKSKKDVKVGEFVEVFDGSNWILSRITQIDDLKIVKWRRINRALTDLDYTSLKTVIAANRGDEIGIFPSYAVFCSIIQTHVRKWKSPMEDLFVSYESIVTDVAKRAAALGGDTTNQKLSFVILETLRRAIDEARTQARQALGDVLASEMRPYTLNHDLFDILKKMRNDPVAESLKALAGPSKNRIRIDHVLAILTSLGIGQENNEDREALEMYHAVKAYLKISKKRFIDSVPMSLEMNFVAPLMKALKDGLMLDDGKLEHLLAESTADANARKRLIDEIDALTRSQMLITEMGF